MYQLCLVSVEVDVGSEELDDVLAEATVLRAQIDLSLLVDEVPLFRQEIERFLSANSRHHGRLWLPDYRLYPL